MPRCAAGDELVGALRAADDLSRRARRHRRQPPRHHRRSSLPLLLRPEARVREVLEDPVLDPDHAARAAALASNGCAEQIRVGGIGVERHALVGDLLADACAAARLRERAASFVGMRALNAPPSSGIRSSTACGSSTAVYSPGSIACGLRLATAFCAATRPSDAGSICAPVARAGAGPAADPVPSGVRAVTEKSASRRAVIREQPVARRHGRRAGVRLEEAGRRTSSPAGLPAAVAALDQRV